MSHETIAAEMGGMTSRTSEKWAARLGGLGFIEKGKLIVMNGTRVRSYQLPANPNGGSVSHPERGFGVLESNPNGGTSNPNHGTPNPNGGSPKPVLEPVYEPSARAREGGGAPRIAEETFAEARRHLGLPSRAP